jgi:hypothetical protein
MLMDLNILLARSLATSRHTSRDSGSAGKQGKITLDKLVNCVEHQNLVIQALLMLLREKKVISDEEILQWVNYVDDLDGSRDGALHNRDEPLTCPECKRKNKRDAVKCQYCGKLFSRRVIDPRGNT